MRARERAGERFKSECMAKVIGTKRMNKTSIPFFKVKGFTWGDNKKELKKRLKSPPPLLVVTKKSSAVFTGILDSAKTSINRCFLVKGGAVLRSLVHFVSGSGATLPVANQ